MAKKKRRMVGTKEQVVLRLLRGEDMETVNACTKDGAIKRGAVSSSPMRQSVMCVASRVRR